MKLNWATSTAEAASLSAGFSKTLERGTVCARECVHYSTLFFNDITPASHLHLLMVAWLEYTA